MHSGDSTDSLERVKFCRLCVCSEAFTTPLMEGKNKDALILDIFRVISWRRPSHWDTVLTLTANKWATAYCQHHHLNHPQHDLGLKTNI